MKSFGDYLRPEPAPSFTQVPVHFEMYLWESPHETEGVVNVNNYLPLPPDVMLQSLIPDIVSAIKNGTLKPKLVELPLALMTPTQKTVSAIKVQKYVGVDLASDRPAIVLLDRNNKLIIIDGHHRLCGEAAKGLRRSLVQTITRQQLDAWHQHH